MKQDHHHIVYKSSNIIVRFIGKRFADCITSLLLEIQAPNKQGLDIGCGEGHLTNQLMNRKCIKSVIGCDLNLDDLLYARNSFPHLTCIQAKGEILPIGDSTIDFIIATELLEHVENPRLLLREIVRVLKPKGNLIVSVPNEPYFHYGALFMGSHVKHLGKNPAHLSFWGKEKFKNLLLEFMTIEKSQTVSCFPWQIHLCKKFLEDSTSISYQ
ncbi:class I SAM-dependent methyltransferase [Desulfocastanea catecholica]